MSLTRVPGPGKRVIGEAKSSILRTDILSSHYSRAAGQLLPIEQGHEWFGKRSQPVIEGFEGTFATDRVARSGPPESRSPRSAQSVAVQSGRAHRWRQGPPVSVGARQEARFPTANRGSRGQTRDPVWMI